MIDCVKTGKRISHLRRKHGLSQSALAELLGVTTQAVSKWECAKALPDLDLLLKLSGLFDISINSLLESDKGLPETKTTNGARTVIESLNLVDGDQALIKYVAPYFTESELVELAQAMLQDKLNGSLTISASAFGKNADIKLPMNKLSTGVLNELSAEIAEVLSVATVPIDLGLRRLLNLMWCPICKASVTLVFDENANNGLKCSSGHHFLIVNGVADFGTREIKGELWSQSLKNYDQYLVLHDKSMVNPNYFRGERIDEVMWHEIEKCKPRTILDIASGAGTGVEMFLPYINWPCTLVLTDISHRILKYDRSWFRDNCSNPYVRLAYVACDCASLPFADESFDMVTSLSGFESMQKKERDGFCEAFRVLKHSGAAIYSRALIAGNENSERWIRLLSEDTDFIDLGFNNMMLTLSDWFRVCHDVGYVHTDAIQIYGELPAPKTEQFPFENEIMQWMEEYICVSGKDTGQFNK